MPLDLPILRLPHAQDLPLPSYQTSSAAGMDLCAALGDGTRLTIPPLGRSLVPTGLVFQIPDGYEGQLRPRSGLAMKYGVSVLNSPGTVDADYRGEVKVLLVNLGTEDFTLAHGERIAQIVFAPVSRLEPVEVTEVNATGRGAGGFGSTGT